jgi:hypothetical protein
MSIHTLLWMTSNCENSYVLSWMHTKNIHWGEDLVIRWIKWHTLRMLISISAQPPHYLINGPIIKVAVVVGKEVMHVLNNFHFSLPGSPCQHYCQVLNLSGAVNNTEPVIWHHSQGQWASHLVAGWLHWISSIMAGTKTRPHWKNHIFWKWFAFATHNISARTTICEFTKCFIYH